MPTKSIWCLPEFRAFYFLGYRHCDRSEATSPTLGDCFGALPLAMTTKRPGTGVTVNFTGNPKVFRFFGTSAPGTEQPPWTVFAPSSLKRYLRGTPLGFIAPVVVLSICHPNSSVILSPPEIFSTGDWGRVLAGRIYPPAGGCPHPGGPAQPPRSPEPRPRRGSPPGCGA